MPRPGAAAWDLARDEHLARSLLISRRLGERAAISHVSAAVVHGLWAPPLMGWPVHVSQSAHMRLAAQNALLTRHKARFASGDIEVVNGIRVTSIGRTVIDCARSLPPEWALAVADSGMRAVIRPDRAHPDAVGEQAGVLRAQWLAQLGATCSPRGRVQARAILQVCDPLSESPLESRARCHLLAEGFAPPRLQREIRTACGTFYTDLSWEWSDADGTTWQTHLELDGEAKYGGTEDLFAEKRRENAIRSPHTSIERAGSTDITDGQMIARVRRHLPDSIRSPPEPPHDLRVLRSPVQAAWADDGPARRRRKGS